MPQPEFSIPFKEQIYNENLKETTLEMQRGLQNKRLLSFQKNPKPTQGEKIDCNGYLCQSFDPAPRRPSTGTSVREENEGVGGRDRARASVWPANCNNAISILNNAPLSSGKSSFLSLEVPSRLPTVGAKGGWGAQNGSERGGRAEAVGKESAATGLGGYLECCYRCYGS